jgi:membrane protein YdbS with pleckstrin-like domain
LLVATIMGGVIRAFFPSDPIWTMLVAAIVMALAAAAMLRVRDLPRGDSEREDKVDPVGHLRLRPSPTSP